MTTSITQDSLFVSALPTLKWAKVLRYCYAQPQGHGRISSYHFDAQTQLTIDVKPSLTDRSSTPQLLCGTFLSERYCQHTFADIIQAIRDGVLDKKALTFPDLLSGHDSMVVFFWPDEGNGTHDWKRQDAQLQRQADALLEELVEQAML